MSLPVRIILFFLLSLLLHLPARCQDCSLSAYLDQGVSNNPQLNDLANQIRSSRYDSLIARAAYLPQVNFNGAMMVAPTVSGWGYSDVITNGQSLVGTLSVNQQIFNKKTKAASLERFGLETGNLDNARKIGVNELKKAITAQYLAAYAALDERRFQQEILTTLLHESDILKAWVEKGIYRQTDYLSLQVEVMGLRQNIRSLDFQYRKELSNLKIICGNRDTVSCDLVLPVIRDTLSPSIENSLYFRQFRIDSLRIKNEKLLVDQRYKPAVSWFADGGMINNEPKYIYQNFGISGGISMTLPVFDGNQRKMNYDRIRTHEETRIMYQENFRFRYQAQLKQLQTELDQTRTLSKENEQQIALIKQLISADKVLLSTASMPISDYILALKNLIEANHAGLLYQLRAQYVLNEINFWKQ